MIKQVLVTTLVGALAASIGYYIGYKRGEKSAIEECMSIKEYEERNARYARKSDDISNEDEKQAEDGEEKKEDDHARKIKENHLKNTTDYTSYFEEEGESNGEEDEESTPEMEANEYAEAHKDDPPKVIQSHEMDEYPKYFERVNLFYYAYDEQLTSEENEIITDEEKEILVGSTLEDSGYVDNDNFALYVVNFQTEKIYMIDKMNASYSEQFFGPNPEDE